MNGDLFAFAVDGECGFVVATSITVIDGPCSTLAVFKRCDAADGVSAGYLEHKRSRFSNGFCHNNSVGAGYNGTAPSQGLIVRLVGQHVFVVLTRHVGNANQGVSLFKVDHLDVFFDVSRTRDVGQFFLDGFCDGTFNLSSINHEVVKGFLPNRRKI